MVGLLVLFAAGLVIYNILKISITKRIKEYGTLRAIGGERGQIYRLVSLQLLILCGIGIPIGLVLGTLAAKATLIAATGALNPDIFMANSVSELNEAISAASTVKFPMLLASIAVTLFICANGCISSCSVRIACIPDSCYVLASLLRSNAAEKEITKSTILKPTMQDSI